MTFGKLGNNLWQTIADFMGFDMEISIVKFVNQRKAELDKFAEQWIENNRKNPEDWPLRMTKADWDEQEAMMEIEEP